MTEGRTAESTDSTDRTDHTSSAKQKYLTQSTKTGASASGVWRGAGCKTGCEPCAAGGLTWEGVAAAPRNDSDEEGHIPSGSLETQTRSSFAGVSPKTDGGCLGAGCWVMMIEKTIVEGGRAFG